MNKGMKLKNNLLHKVLSMQQKFILHLFRIESSQPEFINTSYFQIEKLEVLIAEGLRLIVINMNTERSNFTQLLIAMKI